MSPPVDDADPLARLGELTGRCQHLRASLRRQDTDARALATDLAGLMRALAQLPLADAALPDGATQRSLLGLLDELQQLGLMLTEERGRIASQLQEARQGQRARVAYRRIERA